MGMMLEMCNCSSQQVLAPKNKSLIENVLNNTDKNNSKEKNINLIEEINDKKCVSNAILQDNEQNNDAETYNNVKGALMMNKLTLSDSKDKEDKLNKEDFENKNEKSIGNNKKERKKPKKSKEFNIINDHNDISENNKIIIDNKEDYKEMEISDNFLSEIFLSEKAKIIPKEKKNKIKGRNNINIVILGDNEVGKSTFCKRFIDNKYQEYYIPSIGIENYSKIIAYNDRNYQLNFSVFCGEINNQKQENLLNLADFFVIIYDITKIRSFYKINIYLEIIKKYLYLFDKEGKSRNFCLAGNKCDLETNRKVGIKNIYKLINKFGIKHFDVSALTAKNMNNLIQYFVSIFDKLAFP